MAGGNGRGSTGRQVTDSGRSSMKDLFSIAGKVALVTGGARGIGLMITRGFVEAGVKVYIASRKRDECERVAGELSRHGQCVAFGADLGTERGCRATARAGGGRATA